MRNSRAMAFVIASLVSSTTVAQAQAPAPADRIGRQEQRMKGKGEGGARRMRGERGRAGMLKGITLSDAERTQLMAIRARYRTAGKALHDRQVTELRGALSAEHQRVFDANRAARATRRAEWAGDGRAGRMDGRQGRRGRHPGQQRPRRPPTAEAPQV